MIYLTMIALFFAMPMTHLFADDRPTDEELNYEDPNMRFYRERYEEHFELPYQQVWDAVIASIEEINCQIISKTAKQNDEGFLKGKIKSDFCVFATQSDTTLQVLRNYSVEVPFIRGGKWISGRKQFTIVLNENENGTVDMILKCELSGREDHVTNRINFWKSNGKFEHEMIESIKAKLNV